MRFQLLIALPEVLLASVEVLTVKYMGLELGDACGGVAVYVFEWKGAFEGGCVGGDVSFAIFSLSVRSRVLARFCDVIVRENFAKVVNIFIKVDSRQTGEAGSHRVLVTVEIGFRVADFGCSDGRPLRFVDVLQAHH